MNQACKDEYPYTSYKIRICEDDLHRAKKLDLPKPPITEEKLTFCEETYEDEQLLRDELKSIPLPDIDPARHQLAYGWAALPKLNRELKGKNLTIKQIALIQLCDYLYNPEHIDRAKKDDVIATLKHLLGDKDNLVRIKAAECMIVIAGYPSGAHTLLHLNVIGNLAKMFDDEFMSARRNAHKAISMLSKTQLGVKAILQSRLVFKLIEKLQHEMNFIQNIILDTLHNCFREDFRQALDCNAMNKLKELLNHKYPIIRAKTALAISDIAVSLPGKLSACMNNTIAPLIGLLADNHPLVRSKSAAALMMITIITKGKFMAVENNVVQMAIFLLNDKKFEVRLNVLKLLTNVAEIPATRNLLLGYVGQISRLLDDPHPSVCEAAQIALKVIQWKHSGM